MSKYADDTILLVPEHTDININIEFSRVKAWALANHLPLNLAKTKVIVFKRPRARCFHLPPAIDNIEQLDCNKLIGVLSVRFQNEHACSEDTDSMHSANVPNKAAKASGNAPTAVGSYHTLCYCFTHFIRSPSLRRLLNC